MATDNESQENTNEQEQSPQQEQSGGGEAAADEQPQVAEGRFSEVTDTSQPPDDESNLQQRNLEMLYDIPVTVSVRLGQTEMSIRELLELKNNSVVELQKVADEEVDLLINGVQVGKGDVVVVNDKFGLRITEVKSQEERLKNI